MKKSLKKVLGGATSAVMLASGAAQVMAEQVAAPAETAVEFEQVANVQGNFSFNQNVITPADEVFNLFGTAVTGICARPAYQFSSVEKDYYVNVGGKIAYSYTRSLKNMASRTRTMLCACATGRATANALVTGVILSDVLDLSALDSDANALIVKSSDGYSATFDLSYVLDKEAMLVYQIGDQEIASGIQLMIPETVAKYFVRDVVELEVAKLDKTPALEGRADELKAEIVLKNDVEGKAFAIGQPLTFQGYADDLGSAVTAVEFSMDGGKTWTSCATDKATADLWVAWSFEYTPVKAGNYQLTVRARTANGAVSPLAASVNFVVAE